MVKLVVNLIGFLALGLAPYAVAYYAPASYSPGGRQGGKETKNKREVLSVTCGT